MVEIPIDKLLELQEQVTKLAYYNQITRCIFIFQLIVLIPTIIYMVKYRMEPTLKRKLKYLSKQKGMRLEKYLDKALEEYVETYTEEHNIDWERILN